MEEEYQNYVGFETPVPKNLTNDQRLKDLLGELPMKELELTLQLILGHQSSYHHLFEFI